MKKERIIITGSKGVIGKTITEHFSKNYDVTVFSRSLGHDLTDEKLVKELFQREKADYLINLFAMNDHVGSEREGGIDIFNVTLDSFRKYLEINLTALFSVCREFARNNDSGGIVNFSSIYGMVSPVPEMYDKDEKHIGYSVSKAGVIQLTKHLAVHLAPEFRINCIVAGGVKHKQDDSFIAKYSKRTPLGRMMLADELISVLEYFCSKKSSYTTGASFVIDGGWTAV
jgi:NAD(P)-dependent dehydrogenase (short-subunit alcohol dehydrogenase family)